MNTSFIDSQYQNHYSNEQIHLSSETDLYQGRILASQKFVPPRYAPSHSSNLCQYQTQYQNLYPKNAGHPMDISILHSSISHNQQYQEQQALVSKPIMQKSPIFVNNNDSMSESESEPENTAKNNNHQAIIISSHQPEHPIIQIQLSHYTHTAPQLQDPIQPLQLIRWTERPKFASFFWEEEGTLCYQVDANNICVARRQDNDMVNGTKLLNVTGMSRGRRDGILKNDKTRVVVKIGPIHLKGVWIPFQRAKELASEYGISEILNPLFLDNPNVCFQENRSESPVMSNGCMKDIDTSNINERTINLSSQQTREVGCIPSFEIHTYQSPNNLKSKSIDQHSFLHTPLSPTATTPSIVHSHQLFPSLLFKSLESYEASISSDSNHMYLSPEENHYPKSGGYFDSILLSQSFEQTDNCGGENEASTPYFCYDSAATAKCHEKFDPQILSLSSQQHEFMSYSVDNLHCINTISAPPTPTNSETFCSHSATIYQSHLQVPPMIYSNGGVSYIPSTSIHGLEYPHQLHDIIQW